MAGKDIGAPVMLEGEQMAGKFTEQEENLQRMERAIPAESDLLI